MNAYTKISEKGQVVVPKATRDRLGWGAGLDLEVIEHGDSVTLKRRMATKTLTVEEAVARLKQIYKHRGPPVPIDDLNAIVSDAVADAYESSGR